jgi:UDP-N-acetylglucosamine--N-acetylmuramyl-(pentapeptide) pyrophosphoryl-undecaprenol N-acetylglucosamine transferase
MKAAAQKIIEKTSAQIVWQTGITEWQAHQLQTHADHPDVKVLAYLDPIYDYLGMADLVLCRAGASTLAEVTAFGLPSLMVPYPHATDNHQEKNARYVEASGAGICLVEKETTAETMTEKVISLLNDRNRLAEMGLNSRKLGKPAAAYDTAVQFIKMIEGKE